VIELVDTTINYIRVQVSDAKAATLLRDQSVTFSIQGESGQGWISFISPVADPASGLVEVQVSFENPDDRWRPGLQAEVRL
jgi:multidrug efflux pump subunit AcrA (membrane-fusion protein)